MFITFILSILAFLLAYAIMTYKGYYGLLWAIPALVFPYIVILYVFMPRKPVFLPWAIRRSEEFKGKNKIIASMMAVASIVAKHDGRVDADEVKLIRVFIRQRFGISGEELNSYKGVFDFAKEHSEYMSDFIRVLAATRDYNLLMEFGYLLVSICVKDGKITRDEDSLLRDIFSGLGLGYFVYQSILRYYFRTNTEGTYQDSRSNTYNTFNRYSEKDKLKKYCEVLGVDENADLRTIKKEYRKLVKKYHPDEMTSAVTNEYAEYAKERIAEINEAYDFLKEYKTREQGV